MVWRRPQDGGRGMPPQHPVEAHGLHGGRGLPFLWRPCASMGHGYFWQLRKNVSPLSFLPILGRKHFGGSGKKTSGSYHLFSFLSIQPITLKKKKISSYFFSKVSHPPYFIFKQTHPQFTLQGQREEKINKQKIFRKVPVLLKAHES